MQGQESTGMNMSITEENEQPSQPLNPQEAHQGQKEPRETADAIAKKRFEMMTL